LSDATLELCAVELKDIQDLMAAPALSRLADTAAWVQASCMLTEAQGAPRRAAASAPASGRDLEAATRATQSARAALRRLEALDRE
jgi:hypothetical protein